ncbi:MAG: hypothetical protein M0C28_03500 [Candidatus Moduliflexus flocculans]|nr:hypothetical protein [Candidatus Moduliflexus flocculans]
MRSGLQADRLRLEGLPRAGPGVRRPAPAAGRRARGRAHLGLRLGLPRPGRRSRSHLPDDRARGQVPALVARRVARPLQGPAAIGRRLKAEYAENGPRAFDARTMAGVYGKPFEVALHSPATFPEAREAVRFPGGHLDGCRIGFDLGASDYKVAAVVDGEAGLERGDPLDARRGRPIPDYHYRMIDDGLKRAAAHLPRVDAIGGSSAGDPHPTTRSGSPRSSGRVPPDLFETKVRGIFDRLAGAVGRPLRGHQRRRGHRPRRHAVARRAGASSAWPWARARRPASSTPTATSPAGSTSWPSPRSTSTRRPPSTSGRATAASAPTISRSRPSTSWPWRPGCPSLADMKLPERLKEVQALVVRGNIQAARVFESIGVYLGFTVPWYGAFYGFRHLLVLGRVLSGAGGHDDRRQGQRGPGGRVPGDGGPGPHPPARREEPARGTGGRRGQPARDQRSTSMKFTKTDASVFVPDGTAVEDAFRRVTHLGIGAHQDDLEIMAFHGIQKCFTSKDLWFGAVTSTDGAGSPRAGEYADFSDEAMAALRRTEQEKAAILGNYGVLVQLNHSSAEVKDVGTGRLAVRPGQGPQGGAARGRLHPQPGRQARHPRRRRLHGHRRPARARAATSGRRPSTAARSGAASTGWTTTTRSPSTSAAARTCPWASSASTIPRSRAASGTTWPRPAGAGPTPAISSRTRPTPPNSSGSPWT